ncbi:FtsK/SpoIIIE domain-containing protein [Roseimaritima sediminicola]|uniref:FtsK/SpoIIIE domain-containing protein n=1 Tax=Roseimaritima sediminicola TaxID=2662066 RepID=UPI0012984402|nr:FtsK/SpoIIIE domain-containing protein [Roseimaritima sediminicola]
MSSNLPGPVGLLSPNRQQCLLRALQQRRADADQQRQHLKSRLDQSSTRLAQQQAAEREQTMLRCRTERHSLLKAWDKADEQKIAHYESETMRLRQDLNRLATRFRQARKEEHATVFRKVQARCAAVQKQYEARKNLPEEDRQRDAAHLDQALARAAETMEEVRDVVGRRLNGLPDVPPQPKADWETPQENVRQANEAIDLANRQIRETLRELYRGTPSKLVDTFWILPSWAALFVVVWSIGVLLFAREHWLIAFLIGLGIALILFLGVLGILQIPLRRQTRRIYPRAVHMWDMARRANHRGKAIAEATAKDFAADLLKTRDFHLEAAERWKRENLTSIDQAIDAKEKKMRTELQGELEQLGETFSTEIETLDAKMHAKAESLAAAIRTTIDQFDASQAARTRQQQQRHESELAEFESRLQRAVRRGRQRLQRLPERVEQRFPAWRDETTLSTEQSLDFLPVGHVQLPSGEVPSPAGQTAASDDQATELPVVLHRRLHGGLLIDCPAAQTDSAVALLQGVLWHALTGVAPGRCRFTLIDPLGRGQHFAGLMALADHDPTLIGHRVWAAPDQIEARLHELTQHNEDVLQSCLRDQYATLEDYNRIAGSLAEPYRLVAAVGTAAGLTRQSAEYLRALFDSARRCGTFLLVVNDPQQPWAEEMPPRDDPRWLRLQVTAEGTWRLHEPGFEDRPFRPVLPPSPAQRNRWVEAIGTAAARADHVKIPLDQIFPQDRSGTADSTTGLAIPIGTQGGHRRLQLSLGEGVRQHVLIAGKTGSGKSTLLHTIITAAARLYRPDQLQFYLLDFKKGVEFQVYAEDPLPHARVIGIESEREFGRSVLQRLDAELQQRGERFRDANAPELADYRARSQEPLPRILLVVDEFQELFVRDDRIAADCAMYLDRLVRQGRSFGIHVILSSQSLAGSYSLPRATLGQMAVRIALQCSDSDAALILGDDNPAARLIGRPGEAIYNDASGLVEGNQPFQVAWLDSAAHRRMLADVTQRDAGRVSDLDPPVVFAGNRPASWTPALAEAALKTPAETGQTLRGLLGEATQIGPPTVLSLARAAGRNVLAVGRIEDVSSLLGIWIATLVGDQQRRNLTPPQIVYLDGVRTGDNEQPPLPEWLSECGVPTRPVRPRDCAAEVLRVQAEVETRLAALDPEAPVPPPLLLVISPLERFRELRQSDRYQFSLEDNGQDASAALQTVLRDGPQVGVHTFLACQSAETVNRWLPRAAHHDLECRLLGRLSAADSAGLIDTPDAADLSAATMLMYDDADGRLQKFRPCRLPAADDVASWLRSCGQE